MRWYWKLRIQLLPQKHKKKGTKIVFWLDRTYPIMHKGATRMQNPPIFTLYVQDPENTSIYMFDSISTFKEVYTGIKSIVLNLKTPGELYKGIMEVRKEPDNLILLSAIREVENNIKNIINKNNYI